MSDTPTCNRCGDKSVLAGEWGVCADCFNDDCKRFADMILGRGDDGDE